MPKFEVGDMVEMVGVPIPSVKVLTVRRCEDENCPFDGQEVFDFEDPGGMGRDSMHTAEFKKVKQP